MKILSKYEELVGKEIAFSHMAMFANQITIGTSCGCVLMVTMESEDEWDHSRKVRVLHEVEVLGVIEGSRWIREELGKLGIFDLAEYQKKKRIEEEVERKKRIEAKEVRERQEYERLKAKFEGRDG